MSDYELLLKSLFAEPDLLGPLVVFADWLEEQGDERAAVLQTWCSLRRRVADLPAEPLYGARHISLKALEGQIGGTPGDEVQTLWSVLNLRYLPLPGSLYRPNDGKTCMMDWLPRPLLQRVVQKELCVLEDLSMQALQAQQRVNITMPPTLDQLFLGREKTFYRAHDRYWEPLQSSRHHMLGATMTCARCLERLGYPPIVALLRNDLIAGADPCDEETRYAYFRYLSNWQVAAVRLFLEVYRPAPAQPGRRYRNRDHA